MRRFAVILSLANVAARLYRRTLRGRHYITCSNLQRPSQSSAMALLNNRDDQAYIDQFAVHVELFDYLHDRLIDAFPSLRPQGTGRPKRLNSRLQLALCLQFLHSTCEQRILVQAYGAPPATLSRSLNDGCQSCCTLWRAIQMDE